MLGKKRCFKDLFVILSVLSIVSLNSCGSGGKSEGSENSDKKGTPPVPGNSGIINISNVTGTALRLEWIKATDDKSDQSTLQYMVCYSSGSDVLNTVAEIEENSTVKNNWENDISTKDIAGLTAATTYYFNIIVKDEDNNKSAYTMSSQKTSTVGAPNAPVVDAAAILTNIATPTWTWTSGGGGGNGTYRYKLDDSDLSSGATETTLLTYTPDSPLAEGPHILYVEERDAAGNYSGAGSRLITVDLTAPVPGNSGTISASGVLPTSLTLNWAAADDIDDSDPENPIGSESSALYYSVYYSTESADIGDDVTNIKTNGTLYGGGTAITTMNFSGLIGLTTYYFNVIVIDEAGNEESYTMLAETTADGSAPNAPVVNGTTPTTDTTPTWSWASGGGNDPSGYFRYNINGGSWSAETTATGYTPASPLTHGYYTLYVQERNTIGAWSGNGSRQIFVDLRPAVPIYTYPADASTQKSLTSNTYLDWADTARATSYNVYMSTASTAGTMVASDITESVLNFSSITAITIEYGRKYYWKVIANNADGSTSGAKWTFTTEQNVIYSGTVTLTDYYTDSIHSSYDFMEQKLCVYDAGDFYYCYSTANSSSGIYSNQSTQNKMVSISTSYSSLYDVPIPVNFYNSSDSSVAVNDIFVIEAKDGETGFYIILKVTAINSTTHALMFNYLYVNLDGRPGIPVIYSPNIGATQWPRTSYVDWKLTGDATSYDVYISRSVPPQTQAALDITTHKCYFSEMLVGIDYSTKYYWRIIAKNSVGSTTGPIWYFTTAPNIYLDRSGYTFTLDYSNENCTYKGFRLLSSSNVCIAIAGAGDFYYYGPLDKFWTAELNVGGIIDMGAGYSDIEDVSVPSTGYTGYGPANTGVDVVLNHYYVVKVKNYANRYGIIKVKSFDADADTLTFSYIIVEKIY